MKGWLILLLAIPFLAGGEVVWQAEVQKPYALTLKLSAEIIHLDDFLHLDAEFRYPSTHQLNMEALIDQLAWSANPLTPQLNVYQTKLTSLTADKEMTSQKLHAVIRPLAQGSFDVTFLNVSFQPKDKTLPSVDILTPVFTIQVLPVVAQTPLAFAPLMPLEQEFPLGLTEANRQFLWESPERQKAEKQFLQQVIDRHTFPWLTLAILLGLAGIGWTVYVMRDRLPKRKRREAPLFSPKLQAEQALQTLMNRKLIDQGLPQELVVGLSSILLKSLEALSNQPMHGLTTEEVAHVVENNPILNKTQKVSILLFLSKIDPIKFAGLIPTSEEAKQMEHSVRTLILDLNT